MEGIDPNGLTQGQALLAWANRSGVGRDLASRHFTHFVISLARIIA